MLFRSVAEYRPERRNHHTGFDSANPSARYLDGQVDFGRDIKTRAVRLRVVRQWADNAPDAGGVRQTMVEMDDAFLFVAAAGDGSCLAVLTVASADIGLVAYEMARLVKRVGEHLYAAPRVVAQPPAAG